MAITNKDLNDKLLQLSRAVNKKTSAKRMKSGKYYYSNDFLSFYNAYGKVSLVLIHRSTSQSSITGLMSKKELWDAMDNMLIGIRLKSKK